MNFFKRKIFKRYYFGTENGIKVVYESWKQKIFWKFIRLFFDVRLTRGGKYYIRIGKLK